MPTQTHIQTQAQSHLQAQSLAQPSQTGNGIYQVPGIMLDRVAMFFTPPTSTEVMTVADVAEYLKVSKPTVYRLAKEGIIPSGRIGSLWRFNRQNIEEWAAANL